MKIDNVVYRMGLFGLTPAMEAPEDLTATTNDAMKRSGTRNRQQSDFEPPTTSNETRQENAADAGGGDDISSDIDSITPENASGGDQNDAPAGGGNDAQGGDDAGGEGGGDLGLDDGIGGGDDGMGDEGGGDDMGGGGDDFGGDSGGMGDEAPKETPEEAVRIRKLQELMNQFYIVLTNTCDSLSSAVIPSSTEEVQRIFASSTVHLNEAKSLLLDLLTTKFTPGNYAYKLRKYLALRHLYSTILEIIEMHSSIVESQKASSEK